MDYTNNKVIITKLKSNYKIEYNYRKNLSDFIKGFPKEHREIKMDAYLNPDGSQLEKWYRIVSKHYIGKVISFIKDNEIPFNFTNLTEEEVESLRVEFVKRQENLMKSLYLKSQNIDVSKVDFSFMKIEPYKYQKQAAIFFDACNGRSLLGDQPGVGKEAPLDTLISTSKGWVKMGDIKLGDKIHNRFGGISNVVGVYPQGEKDSYKIHFNDGTFTKCGLEHLWNVRDANRRQRNKGWTVKSLKELIESKLEYKASSSRKNKNPILKWEIPITEPVYYSQKKYLIDPYIMGMIIGDGNLCSGSITISIPDLQFETVENILKKLPKEYILSENRSATCPRYSIIKSKYNKSLNNDFIQKIKKFNLNVRSEKKFIPNIYKLGSKNQRKELLKGLMDSDGSCSKNGINFHSSSKRLSEDVVELVQSLGGIAKLKSYNRTDESKGIEYRVNIKVPFCPFHLESKKKEWNPIKSNYISKYISKIEFCKKEEQQCIAVDSKDNTYLTDNFIVTHNTASAMTYACWKKRKTIIICPANLRLNWRKEILKFTDEKAFVYKWKPTKKSKKINYSKEESLFHIIGYDSLKSYIEIQTSHTCKNVFCGWKEKNSKRRYKDNTCPKCNSRASIKSRVTKNFNFVPDKDDIYINPNDYELIIMDEAHYIKNNSADRTKRVKKVFKEIPEKLLLTGTAIKSRPYEFFSLLNFLYPEEFSNAHYFGVKYCAGEKNNFGWNYDGASNLDELFEKISPFFLRRLKKDVLKFLPPKTYSYIPVELTTTEQREYNKIHKGIAEEGKEDNDKLNHLTRIQYLKHFTSMIKLKKSFEFIQDIIDGGEKVVVFSQYKDVSYELGNKFGDKCVVYNGDKSANQKEEAVELFMNDDNVQVFAGTIGAAGVGITLTESSVAIFIDQPWTPSDREQAEDRVHRASSTSDNIQIIRLICENTIDEDIDELLNNKSNILSKVLDGKELEQSTNRKKGSIFNELLDIIFK